MKSVARITAIILALGLLPATAALGGPKRAISTHHVSLAGAVDTVSLTGTLGVPGTRDTDAGILDGTVSPGPPWSGALRQVVTWGPGLTIKSKGTAFAVQGTLRFTLTGKFTPRSAGGFAITGKLVVTGGTGTYKHARGTLRVTGAAPLGSDADASTFDLAGTLRY